MNEQITQTFYVRSLSSSTQRYSRATMLSRDSLRLLYRQDSVVKTTVDESSTSALRASYSSTDAPLTLLFSCSRILGYRATTLQKEDVILQPYENRLSGATMNEE